MAVPLALTIYYSLMRYTLLNPVISFAGFRNYKFFLTDPVFFDALANTFVLVGSVLAITVIGGIAISLLLNFNTRGINIARVLIISPFFIMPTVSALLWKNMILHPVNGLSAAVTRFLGVQPVDWFAHYPLFTIIVIVSWTWLPFATLIMLTALQSLDTDQLEAAEMDGAGFFATHFYVILPHLVRPITITILIETIYLLSIFAEILVTTSGGPGTETVNIPFLVFSQALLQFNVGSAAAGGVVAVILANIVALFLVRAIGKNLD
jgi:sorbitol/mannitol transport system permease protein